MIEPITKQRCQLIDTSTRRLVCMNERRYECWHCKLLICEEHSICGQAGGSAARYCVACYAALFAKAK